MRKTDFAFWTFLLMTAFAGAATVLNVSQTHSATAKSESFFQNLDLFGEVLERVRSDYVEAPNDDKLIENAINGMLTSLDPHSAYLNADHFRDMQVQTRGEFGGLGIEVTMEDGLVKVVSPIDDTPAARAGVQANDIITHLDGQYIKGWALDKAVKAMRGTVNTPITLTIERKGSEEPLEIKIVRDIIRISAVKSRREGDVGYIKISTFNEQTHANLVSAIQSLEKEIGGELKGYIIDLRNNPGGLLDQAIAVSDDFLEKGAIVVTMGRNKEETQRSHARPGDITGGKKVVVLINGGSASASEIVAGALKDHNRAQIIGTRSFGKGSVQTIIPLGANGAIRLTTARYYTPSGSSIQAKGIVPDIVIEQELPEELKAKASKTKVRGEASLPGHLKNDKDDEEQSGSSAYVPKETEKDTQLQYALNLLRGKVTPPAKKAETAAGPGKTDDTAAKGEAAKAPEPEKAN